MKNKLLTLLLVLTLAFCNLALVSAAEEEYLTEEPTVEIATEMTGAEAIAHISDEDALFLDLRSAVDYEAGHIKNSISAPVCLSAAEGYKVPVSNREAFVEQMAELDITGKTLYLSCYAGTFCVNYATDWLLTYCGATSDQLVRVLGGTFGDADLAAASVQVAPEYALSTEGIIVDVRSTNVYYTNGYIDGSLHQPLFRDLDDGTFQVTDRADDLSAAFNTFIEANRTALENNKVFILCNGGASGAAAATYLLKEAGIEGNVFTIENGAKTDTIKAQLVQQQYISGEETVAAVGSEEVVIVDVRTAENYAKGHLKGAISIPVFGADGPSNGSDALAEAFLELVAENEDLLSGKSIYLVCNSGARGAQAATKLLMKAGYSNSDIYTVTGGNKGSEDDMSVPTASKYVTADYALSVLEDENFVIIDVRAAEKQAAGYLEGTVKLPLFTVDAEGNNVPVVDPYDDDLSKAFSAYAEENKDELSGKTILILCNSGSKGAVNATTLLEKAGIVGNVYTIEGGAKNQSIIDAFVVDEEVPEENEEETVVPEEDKEETDKEETEKAPTTGDASHVALYAVAMIAAAAVVVFNRKKSFR